LEGSTTLGGSLDPLGGPVDIDGLHMFQTLTLKEGGTVGFVGNQKGKIIGSRIIDNSSISINNVWC